MDSKEVSEEHDLADSTAESVHSYPASLVAVEQELKRIGTRVLHEANQSGHRKPKEKAAVFLPELDAYVTVLRQALRTPGTPALPASYPALYPNTHDILQRQCVPVLTQLWADLRLENRRLDVVDWCTAWEHVSMQQAGLLLDLGVVTVQDGGTVSNSKMNEEGAC